MKMFEQIMENWAGACDAGYLFHRCTVEISYPNANRELRRIAQGPVVAEIGAGAGLAGDREIEAERSFSAKGERSRGVITEDVGDQIGGGGVGDVARGGKSKVQS